jgi:hypothetical protein
VRVAPTVLVILEGATDDVTSTVVCTTDPLPRVVEVWVVLTDGGGVITVTTTDVFVGVALVVVGGVDVEVGDVEVEVGDVLSVVLVV